MAYTNVWSHSIPAGTLPADQIDSAIQQTRLDVEERLAALVVDINADPVVPKPSLTGTKAGKKILLSPYTFVGCTYESGYANPIYVAGQFGPATNEVVRVPLILPQGVTVKRIALIVDKKAATSGTVSWKKLVLATGVVTDLATPNPFTTTGIVTVSHAPDLSYVTNDTDMIWMEFTYTVPQVSAINRPRLYGARVTYDTPDSTVTL